MNSIYPTEKKIGPPVLFGGVLRVVNVMMVE